MNNTADLFTAIDKMTNEIIFVMGGKVTGVWLYGSVVLDDFRLGWSDIDLIALTEETVTAEQAERLLTLQQEMLKKEPGDPYTRSFEGVITGLDEYRGRAFRRAVCWGTSGQRVTDRYAPDPFAEYELARYGRSVYGGAPWPLPAPGWDEMVRAVRDHCDSIRKYAVRTGETLYSCGWLLDIARCVYTLRYHDVIAKTRAGEWALAERVFPDEASLRRAVEIRKQPLNYRDREDVKRWLCGLGPVVQRYADVLENELQRCTGSAAL